MRKWRFVKFLETAGAVGAGSIIFAVLPFAISFNEHLKDHNVSASVLAGIAVLSVCFGAYSAWDKERARLEELQKKTARPLLAFTATSEPEGRWFHFKEASVPALFELTHLGGEAAQFIQIEPLISLHSNNVRLEFEPITFLDAVGRNVVLDFRLLLSGQEINAADKVRNVADVFFLADARKQPHLATLEYRIAVKFKWNDEWQQDALYLSWNSASRTLKTRPTY